MATSPTPKCRNCGSNKLITILDLGSHAVSNFITNSETPVTAPLTLVMCDPHQDGCGLVQLAPTGVSPEALYRTYWYASGVNQSMKGALKDVTGSIEKFLLLNTDDIVLDIGANDGTLLRSYTNSKIKLVGFEPAKNLLSQASLGTGLIVNEFFTSQLYMQALMAQQARVVTTIAMFYDIDNPNGFIDNIASVLAPNGLWVNQMADLTSMIRSSMFDNICHEHLCYYSLAVLEPMLTRHNLKVIDITQNEVNGGSFRLYITHINPKAPIAAPGAAERIAKYRHLEEIAKLTSPATYQAFAERVANIKKTVTDFIGKLAVAGKTIMGYGASTKGNTLLQYFNLTYPTITAIAERNPTKVGRKTVATNIPIISEAEMRQKHPDYLLALPWHFKGEFLLREEAYVKAGGTFLFPLPKPQLISWKNNHLKIIPLDQANA